MSQFIFNIGCILLSVSVLSIYETDAQCRIGEFEEPPVEYRPVPLWFWNNAEVDTGEAVSQFRNMIGRDFYGGCAILPFGEKFRPEYLSEEYFDLYGRIVEEAGKAGAQMSVYDEFGFPSGSMGAINGDGRPRFMERHPGATVKRLDKTEYSVRPGELFRARMPEGKIMSVVAMDSRTKEIISLKGCLSGRELEWKAPDGDWTVMCFTCVIDGDPNVDYLSPEAVEKFVEEVHQQYYLRYGDAFGSVITETFFDEPTMYRAQGRMWTYDFNEKFEKEYGFSPELMYPALWYDIGPATPSARNLMFGFRSRLYSEGFMKTISEWAGKHGIQATGHQDQEEIANPVSVAGDLMLDMKYQSIPGIDKIGGGRPTEDFYKVVSSAAYNWDKTQVMSETYGAMGNIPADELYSVAMEQYTKGINRLIPHAVWYNDADVTFLPELSGRNPLYREMLPDFNRFLSRLNYMLRQEAGHVADIAVIYPIQSLQSEHYLDGPEGYYMGGVRIPYTDYPRISAALTDTLCRDFTYIHPEVMDSRCKVSGGRLVMCNKVNRESFSVVIVPGMKTISVSCLKKLERFADNGGSVIFTSRLPYCSAEPGQDAEVQGIVDRMLETDRKAVFIEKPDAASILSALENCGGVSDVEFGKGSGLRYIHKKAGRDDIYYFANLRKEPVESEIRLKGKLRPVLLDPHTGGHRRPEYRHVLEAGVPVTMIKVNTDALKSFFIIDEGYLCGDK